MTTEFAFRRAAKLGLNRHAVNQTFPCTAPPCVPTLAASVGRRVSVAAAATQVYGESSEGECRANGFAAYDDVLSSEVGRFTTTSSMRPNFLASSGLMNLSRST